MQSSSFLFYRLGILKAPWLEIWNFAHVLRKVLAAAILVVNPNLSAVPPSCVGVPPCLPCATRRSQTCPRRRPSHLRQACNCTNPPLNIHPQTRSCGIHRDRSASSLLQIAEAAYSNKGVAVSPCHVCGVAASADMAHILSLSLGHTLEGSELRIGHAAVALLNARLGGGPPGGAALPLLLAEALPALDLPSSSNGSWPAKPSRNSSPASVVTALEQATPPHKPPQLHNLSPAPAPRFKGDVERPSLLPPLPTFTASLQLDRTAHAPEGAARIPPVSEPAWPLELPKPSGGVFAGGPSFYGGDSKMDLLEAIQASSAWQPAPPASAPPAAADPYLELPESIPGLTAYPMPHCGISVLLTSKARAGEAAFAEGRTPADAAGHKGTAEGEAPNKDGFRRPQSLPDDFFGGEGPAIERQLSADELAIKSYLEEGDHAELCSAGEAHWEGYDEHKPRARRTFARVRLSRCVSGVCSNSRSCTSVQCLLPVALSGLSVC